MTVSARRIKTDHWTADFQIAAALAEAYRRAGKTGVSVVTMGDPARPEDYLSRAVAEDLARYHPNVFGTPERPVYGSNFEQAGQAYGRLWQETFAIAVAPVDGSAEELGAVTIYPNAGLFPHGIDPDAAEGRGLEPVGDVALYAVAGINGMDPAVLLADRGLRRRLDGCARMIVDGVLRFFMKIGYDHTVHERRMRARARPAVGQKQE